MAKPLHETLLSPFNRPMGGRTKTFLKRLRIKTVAELAEFEEAVIKGYPGFGKHTFRDLHSLLHEHGLQFKDTPAGPIAAALIAVYDAENRERYLSEARAIADRVDKRRKGQGDRAGDSRNEQPE